MPRRCSTLTKGKPEEDDEVLPPVIGRRRSGWCDQGGGFKATGKLAAALVKGAQLKVYAGAPHAAATTHADQVNADPPAFFMS